MHMEVHVCIGVCMCVVYVYIVLGENEYMKEKARQ